MKIANDLRWMNSGPLAGLGEIALPALQPGSSIMPGKVNPVIPEATAMVAAQVIGNDATITIAGQSGNFQLNVMLPVIAYNLLESIRLLANVSRLLAIGPSRASRSIGAPAEALDRNPILVTALNPVIGYEKGAAIAKKAYAEGRPIREVAAGMTDLPREQLDALLDPPNSPAAASRAAPAAAAGWLRCPPTGVPPDCALRLLGAAPDHRPRALPVRACPRITGAARAAARAGRGADLRRGAGARSCSIAPTRRHCC
jgi:hypothetical protein